MAQQKQTNIIWDRDHFYLKSVISDCDPADHDLEIYDFMERIAPHFDHIMEQANQGTQDDINNNINNKRTTASERD